MNFQDIRILVLFLYLSHLLPHQVYPYGYFIQFTGHTGMEQDGSTTWSDLIWYHSLLFTWDELFKLQWDYTPIAV